MFFKDCDTSSHTSFHTTQKYCNSKNNHDAVKKPWDHEKLDEVHFNHVQRMEQ